MSKGKECLHYFFTISNCIDHNEYDYDVLIY